MRIIDWDLNLKVRLFGEFLTNVLFWMFFPFMAIYFADTLGKDLAGILLIASQTLGVIANLVGGYCADRFGRRTMMLFSAFGQGVFFVGFAFCNSPWFESPILSFICFSIIGLFGSFYWPASHAMVADVVPEKDRSQVFAVFYTAINISVVIGPILGGIFFFHYRFGLLIAAALASFLLTILIYRLVRETVPERKADAFDSQNNYWFAIIKSQLKDYRVIITDKAFLLFIVGGILIAQSFTQMDLLIAVYMSEQVPHQEILSFGNWSLSASGEEAFGWIIAENGLLVALFTVFVTRWMSKYNERNVFVASALMYGIAMLTFGHTTSLWIIALGMVIFTTGELMTAGIQDNFISRIAPEHMRGQYFAASSLRYTIGRTIAPIVIPLSGWVGYNWTFNILFILTLLSGLMFWFTFKLVEAKGKKESTANE
jgi:MFS transporter, DHA1 family, multidrug resistance protein B